MPAAIPPFAPGPEAVAASNRIAAILKTTLKDEGVGALIEKYGEGIAALKAGEFPVGTAFGIGVPSVYAPQLEAVVGPLVAPKVWMILDAQGNLVGTAGSEAQAQDFAANSGTCRSRPGGCHVVSS